MTRGKSELQTFAAGRYQVKRPLGEGSRKRVYLAHDTRLDRPVALALIKTDGLDATGLARVRQEAHAMGRLGDHPHIVTVYDVGEVEGQPYIVSQFMAGGSVADLLEASRGDGSEGSTGEGGAASPTRPREPSRPLRLDETLRIGDHRQAAATADRARSTVTQRLRAAIRKIGERHPALADHLARRVKTGIFCAYSPDPTTPITWRVD